MVRYEGRLTQLKNPSRLPLLSFLAAPARRRRWGVRVQGQLTGGSFEGLEGLL